MCSVSCEQAHRGGLPQYAWDLLQRYDPATNTVELLAPMPGPNAGHAATLLDGEIFVMGGSAHWQGEPGTTHYIYDIASDTWRSGAPVPLATTHAAAATDGERIYLLGGFSANWTPMSDVQVYDPATDSWTVSQYLQEARVGAGAFFDGEHVWAVGGSEANRTSTEFWNGSVWQYGPPTQSSTIYPAVAFGAGVALRAGGYAELLDFTCSAGPTPTASPTIDPNVTPSPTGSPTLSPTGAPTSNVQLSTFEGDGSESTPWLFVALVGVASLAGAAWHGARRRG